MTLTDRRICHIKYTFCTWLVLTVFHVEKKIVQQFYPDGIMPHLTGCLLVSVRHFDVDFLTVFYTREVNTSTIFAWRKEHGSLTQHTC